MTFGFEFGIVIYPDSYYDVVKRENKWYLFFVLNPVRIFKKKIIDDNERLISLALFKKNTNKKSIE